MKSLLLIVSMLLMTTLTASNKSVKGNYSSSGRDTVGEQAEKIVHDVRIAQFRLQESWRNYRASR